MQNVTYRSGLIVLATMLAACGGGTSGDLGPSTPTPTPVNNTAPIVASANADQNAQVGVAFSYDASQSNGAFSDADGDTLTYTVTYSPNGQGLSDRDGIISGTPSQAGTVSVTITASDGNGGEVSDTFDIMIAIAATSSANTPNIIFVISDDQGKDASAEYNFSTDLPNTPNLSALANSGIIFDNLWVSPTCSPTRAGLITGKHSTRTTVFAPGDPLPTSETILQKYLKNNPIASNYASAMVGKWHLGGGQTGPNDFGVDHFAGIITGGVSDYFNWNLNINGTRSPSTNYVTSELTDQAIDWVGDQTSPWFLWLSYNAPHTPFHLPPTDLHARTLSGTDADIAANPRPYFLASIEALDTEFGRLWGSLSAQEQADTIVIYIGDNGSPATVIDRTQQSGNKGTLFQGGVNTPMFVSGAGVTRMGEREDSLINHTDFFATIAELTGADLSNFNDGQSFMPLLVDQTATARDVVYAEANDGWTIRNTQYKLIEATDGSQDLFDLQADPTELSDLLAGTTDVSATLLALEDEAAAIRNMVNISGAKFSNTSPNCSDYVGSYRATATDIARNINFDASLIVSSDADKCTFTSNSLPNHDFNDGAGAFPNLVGPVTETFSFPIVPTAAANPTELSLSLDNAILLNGVKADVLAAACFGVGNERVGCNDPDQPWRFDPMHGPNGFNVDDNNAHTQPDGAYHYHGPPPITNGDAETISGAIGYAADGFPIFGSYFDDNGTIRTAQSSYRLRSGERPSGTGEPGGTYDGQFRDDYEFVSGLGDLDVCNGMTQNGQYAYYVTGTFPYLANCFTGTPDPSFNK